MCSPCCLPPSSSDDDFPANPNPGLGSGNAGTPSFAGGPGWICELPLAPLTLFSEAPLNPGVFHPNLAKSAPFGRSGEGHSISSLREVLHSASSRQEFGEDQAVPPRLGAGFWWRQKLRSSLDPCEGGREGGKTRERCHESRGCRGGRNSTTLRSWQRSLWEPRGGSFKPIPSLRSYSELPAPLLPHIHGASELGHPKISTGASRPPFPGLVGACGWCWGGWGGSGPWL